MEEQEVNRMRDMALRYFEGHLVLEEEKILFNSLQGSDVNVQLFKRFIYRKQMESSFGEIANKSMANGTKED